LAATSIYLMAVAGKAPAPDIVGINAGKGRARVEAEV
jgi:hypothetical protein